MSARAQAASATVAPVTLLLFRCSLLLVQAQVQVQVQVHISTSLRVSLPGHVMRCAGFLEIGGVRHLDRNRPAHHFLRPSAEKL